MFALASAIQLRGLIFIKVSPFEPMVARICYLCRLVHLFTVKRAQSTRNLKSLFLWVFILYKIFKTLKV